MTQQVEAYKAQARRLLKHMTGQGIVFSYSQSLEAIAASHGSADWRTLQAAAAPVAAPVPAAKPFLGYGGRQQVQEVTLEPGTKRYVISESWGHLFGPGRSETIVRWIYDRTTGRIIALEYWVTAVARWDQIGEAAMLADVEDSLLNGNPEALENLEDWDLTESDVPQWAQP